MNSDGGEVVESNSATMRAFQHAAPLFVVATLLALFLAPLAIGARVLSASSKLSDVDDPARLALDVIALTTASQAAAIRAVATVSIEEQAPFATAYRQARDAQRRAFDSLTPILSDLDDETRRHVHQLRRDLATWQALHDALLRNQVSADTYTARSRAQQDRLSAVVRSTQEAFASLNEETFESRSRLAALTRLQIAVTAGLAILAMASIFVAMWLGTRAQRLDAALRERLLAEQLADARADVLSWVSHDLKNPLAAIRMGCTNLRRSLEKNPARAPRIVDTIDRSALRMSRLIRDLLDSARLEAGRALVMDTRAVPLKDVAERICDEAEQAAGGEGKVLCEMPAGLPLVHGDRLRIEQALLNLVQNALRVSPAGGAVRVGATEEDGFVVVSVHDDGPGIPDETRARLFKPFRAAGKKPDSTGLGLFIVKAVVDAHGGRVWFDTGAGQGTTFYFTVPVHAPREEAAAQANA